MACNKSPLNSNDLQILESIFNPNLPFDEFDTTGNEEPAVAASNPTSLPGKIVIQIASLLMIMADNF